MDQQQASGRLQTLGVSRGIVLCAHTIVRVRVRVCLVIHTYTTTSVDPANRSPRSDGKECNIPPANAPCSKTLTHQHGWSNRLIRLLLSTAVTICFNGVFTQNFFAEGVFECFHIINVLLVWSVASMTHLSSPVTVYCRICCH